MNCWWENRTVAALVTAPTWEPISPDELKMRARHDRADEDRLLDGFIRAARQHVERDTDLAIPRQTWRATTDQSGTVVLPRPPLLEVTEVSALHQDGTTSVLDPSNYYVVTDASPARIVLPGGFAGFVITYDAGWPTALDVPPLLAHAVGILAVHYLTLGRDLVSMGVLAEVPQTYLDAVQPFRLVGVV